MNSSSSSPEGSGWRIGKTTCNGYTRLNNNFLVKQRKKIFAKKQKKSKNKNEKTLKWKSQKHRKNAVSLVFVQRNKQKQEKIL